jgi:hypothetical protein
VEGAYSNELCVLLSWLYTIQTTLQKVV